MIEQTKFVEIPSGTVTLRDHRFLTIRNIEVASILMGAYPVTERLLRSLGSSTLPATNLPATNVSWLEAVSFCNELSARENLPNCYEIPEDSEDGLRVTCKWELSGYRLPTEAEWQHACQAGSKAYQYDIIDHIAWYAGNSDNSVKEVGLKAPNAWGLCDMLGNVWEWCWDIYNLENYGPYRVYRGGSYAETARSCGATSTRRTHPTYKSEEIGFRLVRSIL